APPKQPILPAEPARRRSGFTYTAAHVAETARQVAVGGLRSQVAVHNAERLELGAFGRRITQGVDQERPDVASLRRVVHPGQDRALAGEADAGLRPLCGGSANPDLGDPKGCPPVAIPVADSP